MIARALACAGALTSVALGCGKPRDSTATAPATSATPADAGSNASLDGVWGGELAFDTGPHGTLELERRDTVWHAHLGTFDTVLAPVKTTGVESIRTPGFDLLGGALGTARLRVHIDDRGATGHWIQPETVVDRSFATPLVFAKIDATHYRATVEPVPAVLRVFVSISGDRAFVKEPGRNLGKQFGPLTVTHDGNAIAFKDKQGEVTLTATRSGDHMQLHLVIAKLTVEVSRRGRTDAEWFYARPPGAVDLAAPAAGDDGWRVATPEAEGFDRAALAKIVRDLAADVPDGASTRAIHALVIARHGALVVEEYFGGDRADTLHDLRSAGKSFTTTLAGIAIDRGKLALDDRLYPTLGVAGIDQNKFAIQLKHVMSMSTGLACNDGDDASPGNEDAMYAQTAQRDWYQFTLDLPVLTPPGTGVYCSGGINLTGAMLVATTHRWLPELFRDELFAPLGIAHYAVPVMPTDEGYGGGALHLRARDFAKLAQLFVAGGMWNGKRIVSAAWTRNATAAHANLDNPDDYGYGWWRQHYSIDGHDYDAFFASGNGGQLAIGIPQLDLVVTFNAANYNARKIWQHFLDDLVPAIVRAIHP